MDLKYLATLAAALIATAPLGAHAESKCGAGACGKKECKQGDKTCDKKEASCGKKDQGCAKK